MAGAGFRVLDGADEVGYGTWLDLWKAWPGREASAHPAFSRLFCRDGDRAMCATLVGDGGCVLFPFILRALAREPWAGGREDVFDITTSYGYGGAFCWGTADGAAFWEQFETWAKAIGVVSCFARLSLFPEQIVPFAGEVEVANQNVVRELAPAVDEIWMDYEHKVRKNVNRALREGLEIEVDATGRRLEEFVAIYFSTLQRRKALEGYFFSVGFFRRLIAEMGDEAVFFHALKEGRVVSSELILVSAEHIYSFLGGTVAGYFPLRPNDLLKHEVIKWGRQQGKKAFVLGGGYDGPDGIFRYKRSFAPSGVVPFTVGKWILDQGSYCELGAKRAAWEAAQGAEWRPLRGYFPAYRA